MNTKVYFSLVEERKKWKMVFSHTAGAWIRFSGCKGHVTCKASSVMLLSAIADLPPSPP